MTRNEKPHEAEAKRLYAWLRQSRLIINEHPGLVVQAIRRAIERAVKKALARQPDCGSEE